ncbi:hypothetical protein TELCIR_12879 [Teladorsagia circumcincta]|uniref:Uncharacterized protein n=1 Tax=Teladorsagia circumcincta TaxID=45464 RepID=A0A2G9U7H8_TELCI|nr:hypothetical protein TELCIR_12879 [Teladorsagia circumcincta]
MARRPQWAKPVARSSGSEMCSKFKCKIPNSVLRKFLVGREARLVEKEYQIGRCNEPRAPVILERLKGAKIQLLDLPGIIEGAKDGKGRGKQVIAGISLHIGD